VSNPLARSLEVSLSCNGTLWNIGPFFRLISHRQYWLRHVCRLGIHESFPTCNSKDATMFDQNPLSKLLLSAHIRTYSCKCSKNTKKLQRNSTFPLHGFLLPLLRIGLLLFGRLWILGIDFEKVVQDDEEHGYGTEEEREAVKVWVGYHGWSGKGALMVVIRGGCASLAER